MHRELVERMLDGGHERANFAIVAAGANAASPHHDPSDRVIVDGDVVLCDFGGTMHGYCSDITRMFVVGEPSTPRCATPTTCSSTRRRPGVQAATVGTPCEEVDAAARRVIADAGFGEYFVHRTGHGIGTEAHEDPVHRRRATRRRSRRATRSASSRASTSPAASACGSRTSWSPPTRGPSGSTTRARDLAIVG